MSTIRFTAPVRRGLGRLSVILRRVDDPNSPPTDTALCRVLNGANGRGPAGDLRRALLWLQQFEGDGVLTPAMNMLLSERDRIDAANRDLSIVGLPPIGGRPPSNAYAGDASRIGRNLDTTA